MYGFGQDHIYIYGIYGILAGKALHMRSYMVHICMVLANPIHLFNHQCCHILKMLVRGEVGKWRRIAQNVLSWGFDVRTPLRVCEQAFSSLRLDLLLLRNPEAMKHAEKNHTCHL